MSVIGMIRRRLLLLAIGALLAACEPSGASAPATAPAVGQTVASTPPAQATIGARGTASTTSISIAAPPTTTRAATVTNATPIMGCDNAAVTALVARFLDAYNAGDGARLLAFFPARAATRGLLVRGEETYFQRYWDVRKSSLRDEDGFAAYVRDDLPPYWALRHAQHERLQLLAMDGGGADRFDLAGIGFMLTRQADDLPTHTVIGKAEIDCGQNTFTIWSMGPQEQPSATPTRP